MVDFTHTQEKTMNQHFKHLANMVRDLRSTSSTLDKQSIIKDYCTIDYDEAAFVKKVLLYTYHPLWQYHVTSDNLKKKSSLRGKEFANIFSLLDALRDRQITGHDAIGAVNTFVSKMPEYEELIHCIIDKDLKTRAGDKIINKAFPDWIPEFSVALADKYEPKLVDWRDGWYVSRKIDGARCIAIVNNDGDSVFYSRQGKEFTTLGIIADAIKVLGIKNVVLDGELCLVDQNGNEDFQGIMKQLKKKDHTIPNPSFKIFDMISHDEFYSKKGDPGKTYTHRYNNLRHVMRENACPCLSVLAQEKIDTDNHFAEWTKRAKDYGWEGLMLRADEPYKGKRSKDLLKYKNFHDNEYEVVKVKFGPFRYVADGREQEEEMLSNVTIIHKGHEVDVGSGFTIDQRKEFHKNPELIMGKMITVQYFEETKNQDGGISLRFPTFKILHGYERTI
jgi:DNA ligase-1